jgi:hypothetical protein
MSAYGAEFRAGAGKIEIQVTPEMLPLENLTTQHDPLTVRVLLMDDGRARSAIVVLEQPSVSDATIAGVKESLTKLAKVSAENAIVVATHTTSAPHANLGAAAGNNGPAAFAKALGLAAERAISQANSSLQPAKLGFGIGTTSINVNRDLPTPKGWAYGSHSAGFSDKSVPVVRIDSANGKPIAVLMNVAVRSVVMDGSINTADGGKAITADLAGSAAHYVEKWYGADTVALFIMGAAVDQAPILEANRFVLNPDGSLARVDIHDAGFALLDLLGERLGAEIVQASENIKATARPTVDVERRNLKVPSQGRAGGAPSNAPVLSYTYAVGPELDLPVVLMRIGDIVIVGVKPELGSSLGAQIKRRSPYPHTMVAVMVDGGAKYMVDSESYDRFTNEARGSQFAQGAAAITVSGIERLLKQMKATAASR